MRKKQTTTCSLPGCERKHKAQGLCELHYRRKMRSGSTQAPEKPARKPCLVTACGEPARSNGYCPVHFRAWTRHGDPLVKIYGIKHTKTCNIEGCDKTQFQRELCSTHYQNYRYHLGTGRTPTVDRYIEFRNELSKRSDAT